MRTGSLPSQLFLFNNSEKRKRRNCGSTATGSVKLLRRDPSGKDGTDHPQPCIALPSMMNTGSYHQDLWGCVMLRDGAERFTSCLWTFFWTVFLSRNNILSFFFQHTSYWFLSEAKQTQSLFPPTEKSANHFSSPGLPHRSTKSLPGTG